MEKKLTPTEWLIEKLDENGFIGTYCTEKEKERKSHLMMSIINQAHIKEEETIIDAYDAGYAEGLCDEVLDYEDGHDYYKKEFNEINQPIQTSRGGIA